MIWILIIGIIAAIIFILWKTKIIKVGNVILITGGVKTGKTTLSVHLANKLVKKARFETHIYNIFFRWFAKDKSKRALPKLYSNIPLKIPYVPLTKDLLYRNTRFEYGSVCYLCEASLIASQMDYNDVELSENLSILVKLFAHETKGGYLIADSQALEDLHYALKRNLSSYLYIHHKKVFPFFVQLKVREMIYCNGTTNTVDTDVEKADLQTILVPKSVWKLFDCYCYSALTDHLPIENTEVKTSNLKTDNILSFRKYREYITRSKNNDGNKENTKNN